MTTIQNNYQRMVSAINSASKEGDQKFQYRISSLTDTERKVLLATSCILKRGGVNKWALNTVRSPDSQKTFESIVSKLTTQEFSCTDNTKNITQRSFHCIKLFFGCNNFIQSSKLMTEAKQISGKHSEKAIDEIIQKKQEIIEAHETLKQIDQNIKNLITDIKQAIAYTVETSEQKVESTWNDSGDYPNNDGYINTIRTRTYKTTTELGVATINIQKKINEILTDDTIAKLQQAENNPYLVIQEDLGNGDTKKRLTQAITHISSLKHNFAKQITNARLTARKDPAVAHANIIQVLNQSYDMEKHNYKNAVRSCDDYWDMNLYRSLVEVEESVQKK